MYRTELINYYLAKSESKNYLEIGISLGNTFRDINTNTKDSVDPDLSKNPKFGMASDEFFGAFASTLGYKYDVIFINGLHHTDQVDRDITNSLQFLNKGGVIVLHDCNPQSEMRQSVPANFDISEHGWNGDVWKSIYKFRKQNTHLHYNVFVIDSDTGLGVIIPNKVGRATDLETPEELNYDFLYFNRNEVLNLISVDEFWANELKNSKKPKIHFFTFATGTHRNSGYPFRETQKKLVDTIQSKTNYDVVFHTHDSESMMNQPWFYKIKEYPKLFNREWWKRDGYCGAWKVLFTKQIMDVIDDGDIIYYTDSSAYHKEGFLENIDRFIKYVEYNGHVCGAAATDCKHNSFMCCDNTDVWNEVYNPVKLDFDYILKKYHILSSWYCFKKTKENIKFIDEWAYWTTYKLNDVPLCRYHHTIEQSLFNMLIYKYGFKVFFNPNNMHEQNKNHNMVHNQLALEPDDDIKNLKKWFKNPHEL
jgi:hypothetical protein